MLTLYIGNKNYSSWSMRPAVLLDAFGLEYTECKLEFDDFSADGVFKQSIGKVSAAGKVPVLVDGDTTVWDSLAIAEYLAETYPDKQLWPQGEATRAHARSVTAEMHSGFAALRGACPQNIEAQLHDTGALLWRDRPAVRTDVNRLVDMWSALLHEHGGPMLFGRFSIADAFFAPVCMRLITYGLPVPPHIAAYIERVRALPALQEWTAAALAEQDFRDFEEPYRLRR